MNVKTAKKVYSNVKKATGSNAEKNHTTVGIALRKLKSSMIIMSKAQDDKVFKKSWQNALYSIYFLQKSLDFDKGGELADNLFRLYEFCKLTVEEVVISRQPELSNLEACSNYIENIIESWEKIYS